MLEPLLISESPDLSNLPDPPAPIQKPVVQVEVIHLVHENKPARGRRGLRRRKQGAEQSTSACSTQNAERTLDLKPVAQIDLNSPHPHPFIQQTFTELPLCAPTVLGARDAAVNKMDGMSALIALPFYWGRHDRQ